MNLPRNPRALTRSAHAPRSETRHIISMSYANEGELPDTPQSWVDPDDAPELDEAFFATPRR